jgi:hypothetical protein
MDDGRWTLKPMYLALASYSRDVNIDRALLDRVRAALQIQLYRDYAPFWQSSGVEVRAFDRPSMIPEDEEASPLIIFDGADDAEALGWHSVDPYGRAYGRAFWGVLQKYGGTLTEGATSLSVTLSHEALEMVGDPYVSFWADIDELTQESLELCDRVEADSYKVDDVSVSNFLGPRAFREGPGPYDYMRVLKGPWEVRPGGYAIRRHGKQIFNVWSDEYPSWKRATKTHPAARTERRHAGAKNV